MRIVKRTAGGVACKLSFSPDKNEYVGIELPNSFSFVFECYILSAEVVVRELFDRFLHPLRGSHSVDMSISCVVEISVRCLQHV